MSQLGEADQRLLGGSQRLGARRIDGTEIPEVLKLLNVVYVIVFFLVVDFVVLLHGLASQDVVQALVKVVFILEAGPELARRLLHLLARARPVL